MLKTPSSLLRFFLLFFQVIFKLYVSITVHSGVFFIFFEKLLNITLKLKMPNIHSVV